MFGTFGLVRGLGRLGSGVVFRRAVEVCSLWTLSGYAKVQLGSFSDSLR